MKMNKEEFRRTKREVQLLVRIFIKIYKGDTKQSGDCRKFERVEDTDHIECVERAELNMLNVLNVLIVWRLTPKVDTFIEYLSHVSQQANKLFVNLYALLWRCLQSFTAEQENDHSISFKLWELCMSFMKNRSLRTLMVDRGIYGYHESCEIHTSPTSDIICRSQFEICYPFETSQQLTVDNRKHSVCVIKRKEDRNIRKYNEKKNLVKKKYEKKSMYKKTGCDDLPR